jgi:ribose transport system ATP-binding protein
MPPPGAPTTPAPVLEIEHVSKSFPGVRALTDVSFQVWPGTVHALLGENGAGKSTLLKILSGVHLADSGEVRIAGVRADLSTPKSARAAGIAMIHQELMQVPELDVAQNMFLGAPLKRLGTFTDRRAMRERARDALAQLDARVDVSRPIRELSVAERQLVEIAKALLAEARIIAMDEPTSSLTPHEFVKLAEVVARLVAKGVAVIYVSHKLEEVFRVASRATVLRDGCHVGDVDLAGTTTDQVVGMMVGRAIVVAEHTCHATDEVVLEAVGLGRGKAVRGVSFALRRGEVLGIAGLVGSGRTELARLLTGVDRPTQGELRVAGQKVAFRSPRDAIQHGIALLPEERKREGIIPLRSVASNVSLPRLGQLTRLGVLRRRAIAARVQELAAQVNLRPPDIERPIQTFSGGNQQKGIICRWLMAGSSILVFDEPTRGIDVGAKGEIYKLIEQLARDGHAIVVISSELPEVLAVSDRVLVMRRGESVGVLAREDMSETSIMRHAVGVNLALEASHG